MSPELQAFLTERAIITVAAASSALVPDLCMGLVCFLDEERAQLRILLDREQALTLMESVTATGSVAAVFSEPASLRTVQVKADDARIAPVPARDATAIESLIQQRVQHLVGKGFAESFAATLHHHLPENRLYLHMSIQEMYEQTPGPRAGHRMDPSL